MWLILRQPTFQNFDLRNQACLWLERSWVSLVHLGKVYKASMKQTGVITWRICISVAVQSGKGKSPMLDTSKFTGSKLAVFAGHSEIEESSFEIWSYLTVSLIVVAHSCFFCLLICFLFLTCLWVGQVWDNFGKIGITQQYTALKGVSFENYQPRIYLFHNPQSRGNRSAW